MANLEAVDFKKSIPKHVAIIMDGNGRWAKANNLMTRLKGHEAGAQSVRAALRATQELGVRYLTLYAFSTENWRRPESEVMGLMKLLEYFLKKHASELVEKGIRLRTIGNIAGLPPKVQVALAAVIESTKNGCECDLILALNYGGRQEIVECVKKIASQVEHGDLNVCEISQETIAANLYAPDVPDPDLMIRTSGELRLSNFLLWQLSYAELYVTPIFWPDFKECDMYDAIVAYQTRLRRYGDVK